MTKDLEDYIKFVQGLVSKYQKYTNILNDEMINPNIINEALANYGQILFTLTADYSRKKVEFFEIEEDFKMWWDEKFLEVRRQANDPNMPASKWLSKQEIEAETRVRNREEYRKRKTIYFKAQEELKVYKRFLDIWKKWDSILMTLSYNMRSEMKSLSIDQRANSTKPFPVPTRRPAKRF